ncbi:phage tail protein [Chryseobacterium gambrini]|nr:phage tail protein [Chryseobacterium gambrini]WBX99122.1 phage tail protein [Chryseobacterium gambrini]
MPNTDFPLPKFHFSVEWGGSKIAFTEVSGLNKEMDVIEHRVGSSPEFFKKKCLDCLNLAILHLKEEFLQEIMNFTTGTIQLH